MAYPPILEDNSDTVKKLKNSNSTPFEIKLVKSFKKSKLGSLG